jgi:microcystin-dependent protein
MADFKSDKVDAVSTNAHLPTGAVIMLGGSYSKYSDSYYTDLGLIPCDGRSLNGVSTIYSNLWTVIGVTFGGSGQSSFQVPNLTSVKKTVLASSETYGLGNGLNSQAHGHSAATLNYNSTDSYENHTHGVNVNVGNVINSNGHGHNISAFTFTIGTNTTATNTSNAGSGSQSALVPGNHTHRVTFNAANTPDNGANAHTHGNFAGSNTGNSTATTSHGHLVSASANFSSKTFDGTAANPLEVPYANVLYFIRI